jgi:hypothetical protein
MFLFMLLFLFLSVAVPLPFGRVVALSFTHASVHCVAGAVF